MVLFETSDGVKIAYRVNGEGKPIIFVHGWGASKNFWKDQEKHFSKKYKTVLIDLRGHGESEKDLNADYSFDRLVGDIRELLSHLEISEFVYVGHSLGGMIGVRLASTCFRDMKGMVITGSPYELKSNFGGIKFKFVEFMLKRSRKLASKVITPSLFSPKTPESVFNFVRRESAVIPVDILIKVAKVNKDVNIVEDLGKVEIPTLVIAAELDKPAPVKVQKKVAEMLPNAKFLIVKNCGHNLMLERPEKFNELIEGFLEKLNY
ncbi:MAG: alpha/beta fold hydrolase [Candidatus Njordarchaeia archaeon]